MSSGIQVSKEVNAAVATVKSEKQAYLFAKVDDAATVVLDRVRSDGLAELIKGLPDDGCRFVFLDHTFRTRSGSPRDRLILISWSPAEAGATHKTAHATTFAGFSAALAS